MRADPRHEHDEEPRQEHLGGVERRLRRRDLDAGEANALGAQLVAVEERLLAADAAQHAQARGGVRAERRQLADLLALLALALLQRLDHDAERERQHRHAEQDEQPELRRGREQDDRDDDVRDDAAGEPRQDVEGAAGPQRVVRHDGDDLARRQLAAHRVARVRHVMADDLGEPEGRLQPVLHRVAMAHHARGGLDDAEHREQDAEPGERVVVAVDDSLLDRLADRVRHQRLRDHPDDPEGDRDRERPLLVPTDPDEQPERRAGVRSPRIGDREIDHGPDEWLVRDAVWLECLGATRLGDPGGVLAPRALEPRHLRVALEGEDVRRDPVEEPAIVGDHDGAAGEVEQRVLERAQRVDVEVVGGLVEEEHVAARLEQLREMDAVALAARQVLDELLLVAAAEVEPRRVLARVHLALAEQDDVLVLGDLLPHRVLRVEAAARLVDVRELAPCRRSGARRCRAAPRRRSS